MASPQSTSTLLVFGVFVDDITYRSPFVVPAHSRRLHKDVAAAHRRRNARPLPPAPHGGGGLHRTVGRLRSRSDLDFYRGQWWSSIAMLNYQRVSGKCWKHICDWRKLWVSPGGMVMNRVLSHQIYGKGGSIWGIVIIWELWFSFREKSKWALAAKPPLIRNFLL